MTSLGTTRWLRMQESRSERGTVIEYIYLEHYFAAVDIRPIIHAGTLNLDLALPIDNRPRYKRA
jgi:hypothetical protein